MELMHNQALQIFGEHYEGLYRVIIDEPGLRKTVLVQLDLPTENQSSRGGRPRLDKPKNPRKKKQPPLVGELLWFDREELLSLAEEHQLREIEIVPDSVLLRRVTEEAKQDSSDKRYKRRLTVMNEFLNYNALSESIIIHRNLGGLVKRTVAVHSVSKSFVYRCFSLLCRYGFSEISLHSRYDRCGAPGVPRPCDSGGRKKAGAKTTKQRISREYGEELDPEQPGMSSEWRARILAADRTITAPKPSMRKRIMQIRSKAFVVRIELDTDGNRVELPLEEGTYPNNDQIRRVLSTDVPRLQQVKDLTTKQHFQRSQRGNCGRSWQGVMGPGHTWAIDSTIGDIYLRSSLNRAWIIGRPIVYIIVDVWSTAVTGFYCCLTGPSWDMAKLSVFSACVNPKLIGDLWGYEPLISLKPHPTLCNTLLCDRGEYLSKGASLTGAKLKLDLDYTPPYRPDLKGLVEVLHRIAKDQQYQFVPGAIDYRRKEFDLKRYRPELSVMTVQEYVQYLHFVFNEYNLTANRTNRLDAHMKAADVVGTPAGLWRWGHQVGIGYQRAIPESELISTLLPSATGKVTRGGILLGGNHYDSDLAQELEWTTYARNFGGWEIPAKFFPGSVSRFWTPEGVQQGLHKLVLIDESTASPELTWDEVADSEAYHNLGRAGREHKANQHTQNYLKQTEALIASAQTKTAEADSEYEGPRPTTTEARAAEATAHSLQAYTPTSDTPPKDMSSEDNSEYLDVMRSLLCMNSEKA